jgi:DNA topoisomerase-1
MRAINGPPVAIVRQAEAMAEKAQAAPAADEPVRRGVSAATRQLAKRFGLTYVAVEDLAIRRRRNGAGFVYLHPDGTAIRVARERKRLAALAVPPAYEDVLYAQDPLAHIQAVGRDAAGRLQYRYHPDWQQVRELRKARRLARLAEALPRIRRSLSQHLNAGEPVRAFALAAVIELVAESAIRPGSESYARLHGTRGAATLLKSNIAVTGEILTLSFRAKGGKQVRKDVHSPRLAAAVAILRQLPGRRLFQYRSGNGAVRPANARDVNTFLRDIAGVDISLKDFRTLVASVSVLDSLARTAPATGTRARRRQVLDAIRLAAADLDNTPAICRKSYVHETVVSAFEDGALERFADALRRTRSPARRAQVLAQVAVNGAT